MMKRVLYALASILATSMPLSAIGVDGGSGSVQTLGTINCSPDKVNIDAGTLYVDCSNNRVGQGTTAPATGLDVEGNLQVGSGATKSTFSTTGDLSLASNGDLTLSGASGHAAFRASTTVSGLFLPGGTDAGVRLADLDTSTASLQTQVTANRLTLDSVATSTAAISLSTAALRSHVASLDLTTATIAGSTASLRGYITSLDLTTAAIAGSTASLRGTLDSVQVATAAISISTRGLAEYRVNRGGDTMYGTLTSTAAVSLDASGQGRITGAWTHEASSTWAGAGLKVSSAGVLIDGNSATPFTVGVTSFTISSSGIVNADFQPRAKVTGAVANLTYNAFSKMFFPTTEINVGNMFDATSSSGVLTVPAGAGGLWMVSCGLRVTCTAAGLEGISIGKNGASREQESIVQCAASSTIETTVTSIFALVAGDAMECDLYQNADAGGSAVLSSKASFLSAVKLW